MNNIEIYNKLPIAIQNYICHIEGKRLNNERLKGKFLKFLYEYLERNDWSYQQLTKYKNEKLKKIIIHSYNTVPYYNQLFNENKIKPNDIKTVNDLYIIPILTKEIVRNIGDKLFSSVYKKKELIKGNTSGSTGTSLEYYYTKEQIQEQFALWWKYRICLGIKMDIWCADFGSKPIVPINQNKPPYWRICEPLKQIKFSAFHGNPENYFYYYKEINKRKIKWIHGYPSSIIPFAFYLEKEKLKFDHKIEFVTTGGENIYDFQRKQIFKAFGAYPYSHYGLGEGVANISEDISHKLIVDEDFSVVEFIKNDLSHRIIGTSLSNFAMPLIRYDTGDLAVLPKNQLKNEKRQVLHIDGRSGELLRLKNGKTVGALSALFTETSNIIEAQLHQRKDYSVEISYVSNSNEKEIDIDIRKVTELFTARIGDEIKLTFKRVDKIPRTSNGKLRYVITEFDTYI